MLTLFKNCDVYAPAPLGRRDILVIEGKIAAVEKDLKDWEAVPGIEIVEMAGQQVVPGLIDIHVHVTGGGGEQGPTTRMQPLALKDFTENGISSVVGLLGTDGISRSLENLLFQVRALEEQGLSSWMLTGNYTYPTRTLTGAVDRDIALIDKCIGAKIALADHRDSCPSPEELARLGTQVRLGSMISGKTGFVCIHMCNGKDRMKNLFRALEISELPPRTFVPTHCCRTPELVEDAAKHNKAGGYIDFTAEIVEDEPGTAPAVKYALDCGADPSRICMSSDGGGSQPVFDEHNNCIGVESATGVTLLWELKKLVRNHGVPFETALSFFTANPAALLGRAGEKGCIAPGADADLLVLTEEYRVKDLWCKGQPMVKNGKSIVYVKF